MAAQRENMDMPNNGALTSQSSDQEFTHDHKDAIAQSSPTGIRPHQRRLYDPTVTFEEYNYYADKTREEEKSYERPTQPWLQLLTGRKKHDVNAQPPENAQINLNVAKQENRMIITEEEWTNASRAFRTASMGAVFYLITTDILGPFAVPYAIGTLGYGPGIGLFTLFGAFAGYSGYLIWRVFMGVDSHEYPARNYGDLAFRTWGTIARHSVNFLQAIALLLLLGQVTILFGGNILELSKLKLCYIVCPLIFVLAGFFLTQVRTLKNFGIFATLAIWLNLLTIFISMGVVAHSEPNYEVAGGSSVGMAIDPASVTPVHGKYPDIVHYSQLPPQALLGSINGLLSGVLAYAGAQLFVEFLAEMRRPRDFLKAMWGAQLFIYICYVVYGSFVYLYQGQYTYNPSYQGVSTYGWQTVGNVLTLIAGLIAAGLYGNIGIKVFYNNVLCDLFGMPLITSRQGKIYYALIVPIWWSIAFIIAASIPAYAYFVGVISASCLLNLTYTIPPFLALGFDIQLMAVREAKNEGFKPGTGETIRVDYGVRRWLRGFFSGGPIRTAINIGHVLYFLASLGMCGLGMYASIDLMIDAFKTKQVTSFSCTPPV